MGILFNSKDTRFKKPFGALAMGTRAEFTARISHDPHVPTESWLVMEEDGGDTFWIHGVPGENQCWHYTYNGDKAGLYFYRICAFYPGGDQEFTPYHQLTVYEDYETPRWLKQGVMYQIFPDRFAKSSEYQPPEINKSYIMRDDWGGTPNHGPDRQGIVWNNDFFGGNLKGIEDKLPYLAELGVTVIYFNPIFEAFSNHRYDTADYMKIDPILGTEEDFRSLCQKCKEMGMRIVLDGVFNHTGSDSRYFNKYGRYPELGAYQSTESTYYPWYDFIEHPHRYHSWWGIETLPAVKELEPSYLDFIINSENSVIRHWIRQGASGWRLDVADELPDGFLEPLRRAVKEEEPDAAVIGEVWEDASNKVSYDARRKYLLGRQLDSVMNYPLKDAIIKFVTGSCSGKQFGQIIESLWENYPKPAFYSLMNILGTHDTERILTVLSTVDENGRQDLYTGRQRLFSGLLIWAFMPGIPCIYYGDEIGMTGGRDPFNRRCFMDASGDEHIRGFYRRILNMRKAAWEIGDMEFEPNTGFNELKDRNLYAFNRIGSRSRIMTVVNMEKDEVLFPIQISVSETLVDFVIAGNAALKFDGTGKPYMFQVSGESGVSVLIEERQEKEF